MVTVIRAEELAEMLGCPSPRAARQLAMQPGFPAVVELSPGRRGWILAEVEAWVEGRKRRLPESIDDIETPEAFSPRPGRGVRRGPRTKAAA